MPTDRRSKREKLRDAKRLARALESEEARNARRARDRLNRSRARERSRAERLACIYNMLAEGNMAEDNSDRQQWMQEPNCHAREEDSDETQDECFGLDGESHGHVHQEDMSEMHQTTFADADTPKDRRTKRERMRDAKRRARAAESDEARNARRARDRASHRRARERMRAERQEDCQRQTT